MFLIQATIPLLTFAGVLSAQELSSSNIVTKHARNERFAWGTCPETVAVNASTIPILCSNFTVPLDYSDPNSTETLTLELIKVPALRGPSKGTIFTNYGGPGASGEADMPPYALYQQAVVGGEHDLINIVPRGTGHTLPFSCWNTAAGRSAVQSLMPTLGTGSDVAAGEEWAGSTIFAANCYEAQNKTGEFIGTAFVARDIIQVADALGEAGVKFWGISYGTILGQALAQLFPDRMERVVLDAVANTPEYYSNTEVSIISSTDAAFATFCSYCAAAPDKCLLAQGNKTDKEISNMVFDMLEQIKQNPIPLIAPGSGYTITYSLVKIKIVSSLYNAAAFPNLDAYLYNVITANTTALLEDLAGSTNSLSGGAEEAARGIRCSDTVARATSLDSVKDVLDARYTISKIAGDFFDGNLMICAQWLMPAKERVLPIVDSSIRTKYPLMLVNNRYDPVTPLLSAHNTSARFEGSVVLETNGVGHSSVFQGSTCTAKAMQAYFVNGTLPKLGTVCEVDSPVFSDKSGLDKVIQQLGFADLG